jgi:ubiquitin C-terminal hydrolase
MAAPPSLIQRVGGYLGGGGSSSRGGGDLHLTELLQSYCAPSAVDTAFRCERCRERGAGGTGQTRIVLWPRTLVVHLMRFTRSGAKNSSPVIYPPEFAVRSLFPDVSANELPAGGGASNGRYQLTGVVLHHGSSGGGHYTAIARPSVSAPQWYLCDDSVVTPVSDREVYDGNRVAAYVLFYSMVGG